MKKRLLSWLMVLTLCLTLLPTAALADGEDESEQDISVQSSGTHQDHCICGAEHKEIGAHSEEGTLTFDRWESDNSLPSSGTYYLTKNVTLSSTHVVTENLTLCLNGYTITGPNVNSSDGYVIRVQNSAAVFTLTDCQSEQGKITHAEGANGSGVDVAIGTFNMYGGIITGNTREDVTSLAGGVHVGNSFNHIFNMYGGSITGNKAEYGGGVYVENGSVFHMYGGTIENNTAERDNTSMGGGVYVYGETFTVSGDAKIINNKANGKLDNIYLPEGKTITIGTNGLSNSAQIGVTTETAPQDNSPVTIATGAKSGDESCFESDLDDCYIAYEDGTLLLKEGTPTPPVEEKHEHFLCVTTHTDIGDHKETTQTTFDKKLTSENDQLLVDETPLTKSKIDGVSIDVYKLDAGNYYLDGSLDLTTPIYLTSGTVNLCLNGHSITLTQESNANTYVITEKGSATLNLTDCKNSGTITHGKSNNEIKYGGGVAVNDTSGTFNMFGGNITGNTLAGSMNGAGVKSYGTLNLYGGSITNNGIIQNAGSKGDGAGVWSKRTFHMYGGEITGNTIESGNGGGVYVGGTFTVSGAAKITGNKVDGANNNVYLPEANTTLVGVIGALTDGAEIGVTPKVWPESDYRIIASGISAATGGTHYDMTPQDTDHFKSDNSDYEIKLESNKLLLTKKGGSTPSGKTDPTYTAPTAKSGLTYNGQPQELINAGSATGGEMQYRLGDGAYSTAIPTATNAGTYTVYYKVVGDETHNDVAEQSISVTIAEKSVDPTPSTPSSSGSSSSGPRIIKTETRTDPDGSVTKTETWSDGTVTETTTGKDGSTAKTTTRKDGSSVTESKAADGTTGTVKTDKNGTTEAAAKVSNKAVEDAKKSGEAVKVPTEVKAGENSNSAPTVKVELPKNAGETKIEIPVEDINSGTVAVIVHPDGTEEIVKDSKPTEDGVQLTVNGSATIKIIDNSKDFIDTRDHWSRDEVNFVVARELFNGVGNNLFGVNQPMTRGMVNTVLARLAGVDTTPSAGQKWYEVGTAWAKANGISDGTNPEASVTREQLATLLYRFYGSPAVSGTLSFADAGAVSDYAQSALLWATQNGILNGVGNNCVAPGADAQRAQVAAMMARYLKNAG